MSLTASGAALAVDADVLDVPITAITCPGQRDDVYFAAGNTVHHTRTSLARSTRVATAPPATTISVIAVSLLAAHSLARPCVFMGAADHLLAQCAGEESSAFSCCVVLRTDEGRVLSIVVDEERDAVVVLTASNDVFCARLHHLAELILAHSRAPAPPTTTVATSPPPQQQLDLSQHCAFTRVRGPCLGVVLAADCLVRRSCGSVAPSSRGGASLVQWASYRLFAATYAGTVVEWEVVQQADGCHSTSGASQLDEARGRRKSPETRIVSRVQPHAAGCAIFATRAAETLLHPVNGQSSESGVTAVTAHTHLITCSDDRSVALYERRQPHSSKSSAAAAAGGAGCEAEWGLLWRGGGVGDSAGAASFARSRVFDVALRVRWMPPAGSEDGSRRRCVVSLGVAGEDGTVQLVEVVQAGGAFDAALHAAPRLVCPRQHRGHGAYRVALAESSTGALTLVSGGFDGVLLAHSTAHTGPRPHSGTDAHALLRLRTDALLARPPAVHGLMEVCTTPPTKNEQVRTVHVDDHGRILACTSGALCVQGGEGNTGSWWIPLPRTATSAGTAREPGHRGDWGMPATLDSLVADCAVSISGERRVLPVACAVVGTTAGALYLIPYAFCGLDGAAGCRGSRPVQCAPTAGASSALLASLTLPSLGKATHIAVLRIDVHASASTRSSATSEFLVASSHVRNAVVLSHLELSFAEAARGSQATARSGEALCADASATWRTIAVYTDGPGALTTTLTLLPTAAMSGRRSCTGASGDGDVASHPVWLLVGDRNGCLLGVRPAATARNRRNTVTGLATGASNDATRVPSVALPACAAVHRHVFAAHLRLAIVAVYGESVDGCLPDGSAASATTASASPSVMLTVAGTGGVVAFVRLPEAALPSTKDAAGPLPATAREPLRLPFDVASVLAITPQVLVAQSGTCITFLRRVPGQSSWVPVGSCDGVRAPRLLTARVAPAPAVVPRALDTQQGDARVIFAHCSDGRTVERVAARLGTTVDSATPAERSAPRLLHGAGLPGKDYNCVAYAPAPLRCLLMGNEDSSLAVYPLGGCPPTSVARCALVCDGLDTPLNVCGAHHSNILAIGVLPTQGADAVRFVTVGGGAMVNLWEAGVAACPLQLLDWWCGGTVTDSAALCAGGDDGQRGGAAATAGDRLVSAARLQKRRERPAVTTAAATKALTDRVARFMAVAPLSTAEVAVGSSDGTLLHFAVAERPSSDGGCSGALRLVWQGVLHPAQPKPVMCVSHVPGCTADRNSQQTDTAASARWLLAGDTNGIVYVLELVTHAVVAQIRLEQSCVNALSEAHRFSSTPAMRGTQNDDRLCWHAAALHDSGVTHLLRLEVHAGSAHIRLLSSVSTGMTAGRSVRWPAASLPLVAVTEERVVVFDAAAVQRGELRVSRTQRVSVRCVSGAAVIAESEAGLLATEISPRVAVVGQGFQVVRWA